MSRRKSRQHIFRFFNGFAGEAQNKICRFGPPHFSARNLQSEFGASFLGTGLFSWAKAAVGDNYLHAECRSALFRFVDDVEFLIDPDEQLIHYRSASRVGYSDFGVNRRRMEKIRKAFSE